MSPTSLGSTDSPAVASRVSRPNGQPETTIARVETATLGAWQLFEIVGSGELAEVFLARPTGADDAAASYAVKRLRQRWERETRAVELFQREAAVGAQLAHPHLVTVLASHVRCAPHYLVMPYYAGETWNRELDRRGPTLGEAIWIARQVAEALDALHNLGWLHGDVKPANVIVSPGGHATLVDLGFARPRGEVAALTSRVVLGTPEYLAPEVLATNWPLDAASDLYSLGAMLYRALAGRLPFESRDLGELVRLQCAGQPTPLRALAPAVPRELSELVVQMLAKDPLRRPTSAREVVERLVTMEIATLGMN